MADDSCQHRKLRVVTTDEDGNEVEKCLVCDENITLTLDDADVDDLLSDKSSTREGTRQ